MNSIIEKQKTLLKSILLQVGRTAPPDAKIEAAFRQANRQSTIAEVSTYLFGLFVYGVAGACAGGLLGFPLVQSAGAFIILCVATSFNIKASINKTKDEIMHKTATALIAETEDKNDRQN
jgi:hypothetical protein